LFSEKIIKYYSSLQEPKLNKSVKTLNPYSSYNTLEIVNDFYSKYYKDNNKRVFLVGINPGRFGGGITGIPFTDPINLSEKCGIKNGFPKRHELSSKFIFKVIDRFGGSQLFFSKFFLTALYPLALIKDGKNYNYYDDTKTWNLLKPEILRLFEQQISAGADKRVMICLGKRNEKFLKIVNDELLFFDEIITFDHPRYIMQYKLKQLDEYLKKFNNQLQSINS
jgi:hypothetical protein